MRRVSITYSHAVGKYVIEFQSHIIGEGYQHNSLEFNSIPLWLGNWILTGEIPK